jgi:hypothetical protein
MTGAGDGRPCEGIAACSSFGGWVGRARGMTAALAAATTLVVLCGCQTTMERSAELQRIAKHTVLASQGVSVRRESKSVKVLYGTVVRSGEGTAVVVGVRNTSSRTLENAPIEIAVRDARGRIIYSNDQAGLDPSLTHISELGPGAEGVWVDDQVQATGAPASVSALVGEGSRAPGPAPALSVSAARVTDEGAAGTGASGTVTNRSNVTQEHLVVYALARRGSRIVAAGRAIVPEAPPGAKVPYQVYFVGDPHGARVSASAPATTF